MAAAVLAVTAPTGVALGSWIKAADKNSGVRLQLLMWIIPWVETR
jgi:hypothetical protein